MSTSYTLLERSDILLEVGEHSNKFDLDLFTEKQSDGCYDNHQSVIDSMSNDELRELVINLSKVYSYWNVSDDNSDLLKDLGKIL